MSPTAVTDEPELSPRSMLVRRLVAVTIVVLFGAFWIWALFFASKEAVNKIGDREWAEQAEAICADATEQRAALLDVRVIADEADPIPERAGLVDRSTEILESMIDEVAALDVADDKGQAIVPAWIGEYRQYLDGRYDYADQLRASNENLPFYEPAVDGLPISERLETFAGDNEIESCAPPRDLGG